MTDTELIEAFKNNRVYKILQAALNEQKEQCMEQLVISCETQEDWVAGEELKGAYKAFDTDIIQLMKDYIVLEQEKENGRSGKA